MYRFSRLNGRSRTRGPAYAVSIGDVTIGWIQATSPAPYPGRSKASYEAMPDGSNGWRIRPLPGKFPSRKDAADGLVSYLATTQYGRRTLSRVVVG